MTSSLAVDCDPLGDTRPAIPLSAPPSLPDPPPRETLALLAGIVRSPSLATALQTTADFTRRWVGCEQVAFHLPATATSPEELAVSGTSAPQDRSDLKLRIEAVSTEIIARQEILSWPVASTDEIATSLVLKSLAELLGATAILALPLVAANGNAAGCWILAGDSRLLQQTQLLLLLRSVGRPLADALLLAQRAEPGWMQRRWAAWSTVVASPSTWMIAAGLAVVMLLLAFIPLPYQVACKAWIEPDSERYLSAPVDGILERCFVKPGDEVRAGQLLARMDDKNGMALVATLEARVDQSRKRRDTALARRQPADAQLAGLDLRQAEQELAVARRRQSQLAIESPIDGVVLAGDLHSAEGMPLKIGQSLFQIAPKSPLIVALAVPERESPLVAAGQTTTAVFDAAPGVRLTGKLDRVHPRAELRDDQNVFVAEMRIDEGLEKLRPGMHGEARVQTEYRSLGWILFHRPWQALLDLFPW